MPQLSFLERAAKLGHSEEALKSGHTISSVISVPNLEELKKLLDDGSSPEEKSAKGQALMSPVALKSTSEDSSTEGLLQRVQAHLYGGTDLGAEDEARLAQAFPVKVLAVSAANVTYNAGETNLGTSQLLITLNYGQVTMNDQAYITVYNSTLNYTMDSLIRNGNPPAGKGDFNILGITGGVGATGGTGATGGNGGGGKGGNCSSAGIAGDSGQNGGGGSTGGTGSVGNTGGNGLSSMPATITVNNSITQAAKSIIIYTASGAGGTGGTGGQGGTGGNGGNGGNGATCDCTGSGAGNGGNGGVGGNGGTGGQGGNAVSANGNVLVYVPATFTNFIQPVKIQAQPGAGGTGGAGGAGGGAGSGGSGGKHNGDGSGGSGGGKGNSGPGGAQGTQVGQPADIKVQPV